MHENMLELIIERSRQRQREGDYPSESAFSVEQLEDAVVQLATKAERRAGADSLERMVRRIHTIPIGGKEVHAAQETCWCHPTETEPNVYVHNAADCRESKERVTGEKSSEGWVLIAENAFLDAPNVPVSHAAEGERKSE